MSQKIDIVTRLELLRRQTHKISYGAFAAGNHVGASHGKKIDTLVEIALKAAMSNGQAEVLLQPLRSFVQATPIVDPRNPGEWSLQAARKQVAEALADIDKG